MIDARAKSVAASIQALCEPGKRAILLFPAGLEFVEAFFGCLYAGVVCIPTPPPEASRLKRTGPRLRSIADDAQASLVVTTSKVRTIIAQSELSIFEGRPIKWLTTDLVDIEAAGAWRQPPISGESLAYLQYTSGSTTSPKGVMIGHGNLCRHLAEMQQLCNYRPE